MSSLHRAGLIVLGLLGTSTVVAACAGSDEEPMIPSDDAGGGGGDGAAPDVVEGDVSDAGSDTNAPSQDACTSAGWCSLGVDPQLSFLDLWPLEGGSAIAIAARNGRSAVMEYEGSAWQIIHEVPFVLGSLWATKTDVWVAGGEPGYVAHGHREGTVWKWSVRSIPVQAPVSTVWGTGEQELYALADARVWRLADDDADWAVDFGGEVAGVDTTVTALTGTGKDDVWVTGARGAFPACGFVAHKRGGSWVTLIEGDPDPTFPWPPACLPVGSAITVHGPATIAGATAPNELVTIIEELDYNVVARIRHAADGGVDMATSNLPAETSFPRDRRSIWGTSADDLYLAGFSKVRRGKGLWADGGSWEISTVALEGIPLVKLFHVVRGTRADDVWLAGESYVFRKTIH